MSARPPYVVVAVVDGSWHYWRGTADNGGSLWGTDRPAIFRAKVEAFRVARRYPQAWVACRTPTGFSLLTQTRPDRRRA